MTHSIQLDEVIATRMPEHQAGVRVVRGHHLLVRCSHWLNVSILLGLILSGVSIYWASPVYQHKPEPQTGNFDPLADAGIWICAHAPGLHQYSSPPDWVYNHISLGPGMLASALRFHWLFAYLFMLNGFVFVIGLAMGGGWRSLLPHRTDLRDALKMFRYYAGFPLAQTSTSYLASSALQHKIQRTSTRRLLFSCGNGTAVRRHGLDDSQTHAASLADWGLGWL
ncbi:MAG TPA: hypothetical protein VG206_26340 [Terriglobia bacterium]|nr:hypothetical protein [Terriglobia bacterium]